jgi:ABC-type branched-subunit amino acid transport system substrate-binding protein
MAKAEGRVIVTTFAEKAKQLLLQDKVAVTFGCWTSVSRKSVLPVFEQNNGLLCIPSSTRVWRIRPTSSARARSPISS